MRTRSDYSELLRDPRWQRMRLEVMSRDNFSCLRCEDKGRTLNVHHTYYERGCAPWEYPAESLKTLCESCHALFTKYLDLAKRQLGRLDLSGLLQAIGYAAGLEAMDLISRGGSDSIDAIDCPGKPATLDIGDAQTEGFATVFGVGFDDQLKLVHKNDLTIGGLWRSTRERWIRQREDHLDPESFYADTLA